MYSRLVQSDIIGSSCVDTILGLIYINLQTRSFEQYCTSVFVVFGSKQIISKSANFDPDFR